MTILVAESRYPTTSFNTQDGAIHYYTRPNANANFTLVQTMPAPTTAGFLTLVGLASNGRFVVAAAAYGPEPRIRIYKVTPSGLQAYASLIVPAPNPIFERDGIAITDNDILVIAQQNQPQVGLFRITNQLVDLTSDYPFEEAQPEVKTYALPIV